MLGLILAWRRFDPSRGVPFECYARWWVRARIVDFVAVNGRIGSLRHGRVGRRLSCELPKVMRQLDPIAASPPIWAVAETLAVSREAVTEFLLVYQADQLPIHEPASRTHSNLALGSILDSAEPSPEALLSHAQTIHQVRQAVEDFARGLESERDLQILREKVLSVDPVSLAALGRRWGVSKQRACQIEQRLMRRLGEHLSRELLQEPVPEQLCHASARAAQAG